MHYNEHWAVKTVVQQAVGANYGDQSRPLFALLKEHGQRYTPVPQRSRPMAHEKQAQHWCCEGVREWVSE